MAVYDAWLRRGKPGRGPSPLKFGLTCGDVTKECAELESNLRPVGMTSWSYYQPDYYQPLLAIRRIADLLGADPDGAAAEWHEWSQTHWDQPVTLMMLFSDYLHAEHEAQEDFSEYLFKNSRAHRAGERYPRITNPHPATYTSVLLAKLKKK